MNNIITEDTKKLISNKIQELQKNTNESLTNIIFDILQEQEVKLQNAYAKKEETTNIPNNQIVLSADIFSKIVNVIAFAENNDIVEKGLLSEITNSVLDNRKKVSMNNVKKGEKNRPHFHPSHDNMYHLLNDYLNGFPNREEFFK